MKKVFFVLGMALCISQTVHPMQQRNTPQFTYVQQVIDLTSDDDQEIIRELPLSREFPMVFSGQPQPPQPNPNSFAQLVQNTIPRKKLNQLLLQAAKENNIDAIQFLIRSGADVNVRNEGKLSPLHFCARHNNLRGAQLLINARADVDMPGKNRIRPIHEAAKRNYIDMVKFLMKSGADLTTKTNKNEHVIHFAIKAPKNRLRDQMLVFLLQELRYIRGTTTSFFLQIPNADGHTPLHLAVVQNDRKLVNILIRDYGVDPNVASSVTKVTPLHLAAAKGYQKLVVDLCILRANMQARDVYGQTPADFAQKNKHDFVKKFFDYASLLPDGQITSIKNNWVCTICIEEEGTRNNTCMYECGHIFHTDCLNLAGGEEWVNKCPNCNQASQRLRWGN